MAALARRRFLHLIGLGSTAVLAAACGATSNPTTAAPAATETPGAAAATEAPGEPVAATHEQVTIRFQEMGGAWQTWVEEKALPVFYEQVPWVKIEYEPQGEGWIDKNLTQMAAGTAPDVMHGWSDVFQKWVSKNQLLDLNPLVASDFPQEDLDDQLGFQWDTQVYKFTGVRYAIPGYVDMGLVYYNKEAFDAKGVAYPTVDWTYDDYADISQKLITMEGDKQTVWGCWYWYSAWTFHSYHLNAFGGHYRDEETWEKCLLSEEPAMQAIDWIRARIWDDNSWLNNTQLSALGTTGDSAQMFATGVFSMMEADIEFWPSMAESVPFQWDIMHVPVGPAGRFNLGDNDGWCIYEGTSDRGTDAVTASWELLKFMNRPVFQTTLMELNGHVPCRKSVHRTWPEVVKRNWPQTEPVNLQIVIDAFDMNYLVPSEQFRYQADAQPFVEAALEKLWQVGDADISIMTEVCAQVDKSQQDAAAKEAL